MGTAELIRADQSQAGPDGKTEVVPATLMIRTVRQEIGVGDRLSPVPQRSFLRYVPHEPTQAIGGQIVSIYGDGLNAGQNQIVALNRGLQDGMERGHVLAIWQEGRRLVDRTSENRDLMKLPDERHGMLFVFQVYARVSYALILSVKEPVKPGGPLHSALTRRRPRNTLEAPCWNAMSWPLGSDCWKQRAWAGRPRAAC